MKVIWSSFAEHTLADIYNYYRDVADIIVENKQSGTQIKPRYRFCTGVFHIY